MKACANCLRIKLGQDWQPEKLPEFYYLVKPYIKITWDVCPECEKMRSGEMVSVCANCFKLRNDAGEWVDADFDQTYPNASHGICPECMMELYPEYYEEENYETQGSDFGPETA